MKIFLAILALLVVGGSLLADYKWRKWMAARRDERESNGPNDPWGGSGTPGGFR